MKRHFIFTTALLLTAANFAFAQLTRDPAQIRRETAERNRALENYDRNNPNRIVRSGSARTLLRNGKIPGADIRSYVLAAQAETQVKVVAVTSGDSLVVDDGANRVTVQILGIDAPEKGQAFHDEAKKSLTDLVSGKRVVLKYSLHNLKDELGNFPARVFVGETDIGLSILKNGFAWRDAKDEFFVEKKTDRANEQAETKARAAKMGIWQDAKPQKPWKYREQKLEREKKMSAKK